MATAKTAKKTVKEVVNGKIPAAKKKTAAKKKPAKKAPAKKAKAKETTVKKETVRVKALKALLKKGPMTAGEVQDAIGLGHGLKPTLDQEVERKHLKHSAHKDDKGTTTYEIASAGRKALSDNTANPSRKSK